MAQSVVLLHGFSGTHRAWDGVIAALDAQRYTSLAPDLPGHGTGAWREGDISFDGCVRHVLERAPERFELCGYSMGARIALLAALASPQRVSRLVLVGATPGIEDARERAQRREPDHLLAPCSRAVPGQVRRHRRVALRVERSDHAVPGSVRAAEAM